MRNPLEVVKHTIAPCPETLWERGGATSRMVEIEEGRHEEVPFFTLEIAERGPITQQPVHDELARQIGTTFTQDIITSDGIDRQTRLHLPTDEYRNPDFAFMLQMDTAWLTSIDGHNDNTAATLAKQLGVPILEIGAEHSTRRLAFPLEGLRLAKTAKQSYGISQAKTAQSSQLITADFIERYTLPNTIVKIGESRGAMVTPAQYPYAKYYGNQIVYSDITAPCVPDQLFTHSSDLLRLGQFPGSEVAGFAIVALEAAKKRASREVAGTITANPNFWVSSIGGIGPALMSGEAGRFTKWVPHNQHEGNMHIVTFRNDAVSRPNTWKSLYAPHQGVAIITLRGSHVTLAHAETLRHIVDRLQNFGYELSVASGDLTRVNWKNVHLKDDDAVHRVE